MGLFDNIKKIASDTVDSVNNTFQQSEGIKPMLIKQAASINYDSVLESIDSINTIHPKTKLIVDAVGVIKEASIDYNNSESLTRDDEFIQKLVCRIEAERVIAELEPIVSMIPFGSVLLMIIKMLLKFKNNYNEKKI